MDPGFFGLAHDPFSIAPDPRFLYLSEAHLEALAHLRFGLQSAGGVVVLTGEIGAGKTTVCRAFIEQAPAECELAYIVNPRLGVLEMLQTVCEEFGLEVPPGPDGRLSLKALVDALNRHVLSRHATGRRCVLVIDEAQQLAPDVLEQLRLLTNLETAERKLLQVVLIGQPELRRVLAQPGLEPLAQRVIARTHLSALNAPDTARYVAHRMAVAGLQGPMPFDAAALRRLHAASGGIPRRINLLAGRALLGAWTEGRREIDARIVERAAREVDGHPPANRRPARTATLAVGLAGVVGVLAFAAAAWWAPVLRAERLLTASAPSAPAVAPTHGARAPGVSFLASAAASASDPSPVPTTPAMPEAGAAGVPAAMASEAQAWRELASLWGASVGPGEPCAVLAREHLRCHRGRGGLSLIRQLDRPVILTLSDPDDRRGHVLLLGVADDHVVLRAADGVHTVTLAALAPVWRGEFATLWRAPEGWGEGMPVARLEAWLSPRPGLRGDPVTTTAEWRQRVREFQATQGLEPDGRVGPLTLMALARAGGADEPRLQASKPAPR